MKAQYYLLLALIAFSCSSERRAANKLKRAERLIRQAEVLGAKVTADTIYKEIPIITEALRVDTVIAWETAIRDTIVVTKENVTTNVKIVPGRPVYVETKVRPDTIRITVPVTVTKEIKAKGYSGIGLWWRLVVAFVAGGIVFLLFRKAIFRLIKIWFGV